MNKRQAQVLAKKLFGSNATARINHYDARDIVVLGTGEREGIDLLLGWGDTWEQAIKRAKNRRRIHKIKTKKKGKSV